MALKKTRDNMPQSPPSETSEQEAPSAEDSSKAGLSAEALAKEGYKKTPLGWLPVEWEVVKIADVATVGNGTTPSRKKKEYWENGHIPWLPTGKVNDNKIEYADEFITEKALEETSLKLLPEHTVLVGMIGQGKTRGMTAITKLEATVNQNFAYIVSKQKLVPFYLFNRLTFDYYKLRGSGRGGGKESLNCAIIKKYKIPLPPLPEQQQIAAILSAWDKAIGRTQALIAAKEERRKGVMQRLLRGKVRVKGYSEPWEEVKIKNIFSPIQDTNDGGDHIIMTVSARFGLISQKKKFDRVIAGNSLKKYTLIRKGDFAYNKGNSKLYEMGCVYQLENHESALVPFVYICFRPSPEINSKFYKHWFLAHGLDRQLKKIITSGARGDGLLNVNKKDFFNLRVPLPSQDEQAIIGEILERADQEITLLNEKLEALRFQKKGLMQRLLTGKIRVKKSSK